MQVDAFTERPLTGNACAVVFESEGLDDETMLAVAREMSVAETAFVQSSEGTDFKVRFFTPAEEIPLAGHPAIATAFALVESGRLALQRDLTLITFELQAGHVLIELHAEQGQLRHIVMLQLKPKFLRTYDPMLVLPIFGLSEEDALPGVPVQTISTGTPQLMIPLRDLECVRRAKMNVEAYKAFQMTADFFSPHLFCLRGATQEGDTFARHFGVPPDLPEDPFTGSATGGMAAFLYHYRLIERRLFFAEQGHWMNRPGRARVEIIGSADDICTVKVGGSAVMTLRGALFL